MERFCLRVSSYGGGQTAEGAEGSTLPAGLYVELWLFVSPALSFTCIESRLQHLP